MAGLGQACPPQVFAIRLLLVLKQRDPMDHHRLTLLGAKVTEDRVDLFAL